MTTSNGPSKGGVARAQKLPPEQRRAIAKKAAIARWGEKPFEFTHKGNFAQDFGIDADCYVLNDENKTAVISQRGMGNALGLKSDSGIAFVHFYQGKTISKILGAELVEKLSKPLIFKDENVGADYLVGYDVSLLIDTCKSIAQADDDGMLLSSQKLIGKQAKVILHASAKSGIRGLVYALAGYDATREEVIQAFKQYVADEARGYEKEFPDQLYREWYRLYKIPKPAKNKPWKFMHLTVKHVYIPLARSNGKIFEMMKDKRDEVGDRRKRLHLFLAELGVKALRQHLGQLLGIAQVSDSKEQYEANVRKVFGDQQELNF